MHSPRESRQEASTPGDRLDSWKEISERDGFRCLAARRLDPATKRPLGDMFYILHLHGARRSCDTGRRLMRSPGWSDPTAGKTADVAKRDRSLHIQSGIPLSSLRVNAGGHGMLRIDRGDDLG